MIPKVVDLTIANFLNYNKITLIKLKIIFVLGKIYVIGLCPFPIKQILVTDRHVQYNNKTLRNNQILLYTFKSFNNLLMHNTYN